MVAAEPCGRGSVPVLLCEATFCLAASCSISLGLQLSEHLLTPEAGHSMYVFFSLVEVRKMRRGWCLHAQLMGKLGEAPVSEGHL